MTSFLFLGRSGIGAASPRQFPNVFVEKPVFSSHRRWREIYLRLQTLKLYNFLIFELPKKNKKMLNNLRHKMERQWYFCSRRIYKSRTTTTLHEILRARELFSLPHRTYYFKQEIARLE